MSVKRTYERTAAQRAEDTALHRRLSVERPSKKELLKSGEVDCFVPSNSALSLEELIDQFQQARLAQGISLCELASRIGIDKSSLSRIESWQTTNPTVATLVTWADGLGLEIKFALEPKQ
jgi:ribosome-binding protein aMBF1 (putative translation factor)